MFVEIILMKSAVFVGLFLLAGCGRELAEPSEELAEEALFTLLSNPSKGDEVNACKDLIASVSETDVADFAVKVSEDWLKEGTAPEDLFDNISPKKYKNLPHERKEEYKAHMRNETVDIYADCRLIVSGRSP